MTSSVMARSMNRLPDMPDPRIAGSYVGAYDVTPDYNPIIGPAPAFLPPDRLYFAGGGTSVRGFAYRSIGGADSTTTGGKSLIEASAEIRQGVTDTISVVGFIDAAMVGTDSLPAFDRTPLAGAGLGLRYKTGLGPLRLDAATPLNPRPGDGRFAIYAGIGQAF